MEISIIELFSARGGSFSPPLASRPPSNALNMVAVFLGSVSFVIAGWFDPQLSFHVGWFDRKGVGDYTDDTYQL